MPTKRKKGNCAPSAEETNARFTKAMSTFPKIVAVDMAKVEQHTLLGFPVLTEEDWAEIYYALRSKYYSDVVQGEGREPRNWRRHLKDILETIGPDGENMVSR